MNINNHKYFKSIKIYFNITKYKIENIILNTFIIKYSKSDKILQKFLKFIFKLFSIYFHPIFNLYFIIKYYFFYFKILNIVVLYKFAGK